MHTVIPLFLLNLVDIIGTKLGYLLLNTASFQINEMQYKQGHRAIDPVNCVAVKIQIFNTS